MQRPYKLTLVDSHFNCLVSCDFYTGPIYHVRSIRNFSFTCLRTYDLCPLLTLVDGNAVVTRSDSVIEFSAMLLIYLRSISDASLLLSHWCFCFHIRLVNNNFRYFSFFIQNLVISTEICIVFYPTVK